MRDDVSRNFYQIIQLISRADPRNDNLFMNSSDRVVCRLFKVTDKAARGKRNNSDLL